MNKTILATMVALPLAMEGACKNKSDPPKADNTVRNKTILVKAGHSYLAKPK